MDINFSKMNRTAGFYKKTAFSVFAAMLLTGLHPVAAPAAVTNFLSNPSFEEPLGDTIGSGNWNSEANRGISRVEGTGTDGNFFMRLSEPGTVDAGFGGVFTFQTVPNVREGDIVAFSGDVRVNAINGAEVAQLRIEFQTSAGVLISAQQVSVPAVVTNGFSRYSISGTAPATTGQATFVMRIEPSTSGQSGGTMIVDVDNTQGTITNTPLFLEANPSSTSMQPGAMRMVVMRLNNRSTATVWPAWKWSPIRRRVLISAQKAGT
jgi:hypothetical protein